MPKKKSADTLIRLNLVVYSFFNHLETVKKQIQNSNFIFFDFVTLSTCNIFKYVVPTLSLHLCQN